MILTLSAFLIFSCSPDAEKKPAAQVSNLKPFSMEHGGIQRNGLFYLPESYDGSVPYSLVFALHGNGGSARYFDSFAFNQRAEELQFIMVYPDGFQGSWEIGPGYDAGIDDAGFFREMIRCFSSQYSVDPERIYVTGHSLGGFMSYRLGLSLDGVLAAIAPVSGMALYAKGDPGDVKPLAVLHIHAENDSVVPFEGDPDTWLPSAQQSVDFWRKGNQASKETEDFYSIPGVMTGRLWPSGTGADTAMMIYNRGGHSWPVGATERICQFFYTHPHREHSLEFSLDNGKYIYAPEEQIHLVLEPDDPDSFSDIQFFLNQQALDSLSRNPYVFEKVLSEPGFYQLSARGILKDGTKVSCSFAPEFFVLPDNMAAGASAESSSVEASFLKADNAVDGDFYSRFSSRWSDRQWFTVDLGEPRRINAVSILWETAYGRIYDIEVSVNGKEWIRVVQQTAGSGGMDYLPFSETEARFVRLKGYQRGSRYGYSFWEFMVHGPGAS